MKPEPAARPFGVRSIGATALLLLVPLAATQVVEGASWTVADFMVAGVLILGTGLLFELFARQSGRVAYRAAAGLGLAAALLLIWVNLAVGIIGDEGNPANLMYLGVVAVAFVGSIIARLRPGGMARAMLAAALAQALVVVIALVAGLATPASGPLEIAAVSGLFILLFAGSATLFREAARGGPAPRTA